MEFWYFLVVAPVNEKVDPSAHLNSVIIRDKLLGNDCVLGILINLNISCTYFKMFINILIL